MLADWLISAATEMGYPVQSTSVPGVAQRTGATTYYVEIFPVSRHELNGREPILSLTPTPGQLDLVAASELVEAGRAVQNGYVDPHRTVLVASTHREYAVSEKSVMSDGRYDDSKLVAAANQRSRQCVLIDMRTLAQQHGTVINTVLFGVMASTGVLPFSRETCENAIRQTGKAVESSLKGFAAGFERKTPSTRRSSHMPAIASSVLMQGWPSELIRIATLGMAQAADFQDQAYATQYLDRVSKVLVREVALGIQPGYLSVEFARCLALRMSFDDVIKVADQKTRWSRMEQLRREAGAKPDEPMQVTEFLKPGAEEICSVLPDALAKWLAPRLKTRERGGGRGLKVRTDTTFGFLMLVLLRSLRPLRRRMHRFTVEQANIEVWSQGVLSALEKSTALALELVKCGALVKGYGATSERGHANLQSILKTLEMQFESGEPIDAVVEQVRRAREAAATDPTGRQLANVLGISPRNAVAQPIKFYRKRPV